MNSPTAYPRLCRVVLFLIVSPSLALAQTATPNVARAFPRDAMISDSGLISIHKAHAAATASLVLAAHLSPNVSSPSANVLPLLPVRPFDPQNIQNTLGDLYNNWAPARTTYAFYFTMMPQIINIKAEAATLPPMLPN